MSAAICYCQYEEGANSHEESQESYSNEYEAYMLNEKEDGWRRPCDDCDVYMDCETSEWTYDAVCESCYAKGVRVTPPPTCEDELARLVRKFHIAVTSYGRAYSMKKILNYLLKNQGYLAANEMVADTIASWAEAVLEEQAQAQAQENPDSIREVFAEYIALLKNPAFRPQYTEEAGSTTSS
jgi:hypothetical protein